MGRINIILPDELEVKLKVSAEKNTRTLTQEILHRIKDSNLAALRVERTIEGGLRQFQDMGFLPVSKTLNSLNPVAGANPNKDDYSEVTSFIEKISDEGYQGTPDDGGELRRLEKEYEVKWNQFKGVLEKQTKEGWIVVWKK